MKSGKKFRVVIIGCGLIGQKRADSLKRANLSGCCDINEEVAKAHPWEGHRGSYGSSAPPPSEWTFGLPSVS